jgi:uncharacterized protein YfiM (DUF2279 family)
VTGCVALACAAAAAGAAPTRAAPPDSVRPSVVVDRWLGADKARHALLAGFVYAVGFSGARLAGLDRRSALAVATGPVVVVSLGKEARDRRAGGRFSVRDLAADALGAAAYAALLARTAK